MAHIYFGTNTLEVPVGKPFEVGVFLDTEGELVNAVSGSIPVPANAAVDHIEDGSSLFSLWTIRPQVKAGKVEYEGILPGGIAGKDLYLFSVFARANAQGEISFVPEKSRVLLHDGEGTDAKVTASTLRLSATPDAQEVDIFSEDHEPPEPFVPSFVQDPLLFEGNISLVFSTADKKSGIDHYTVKEFRPSIFAGRFSPDVVTESPYVMIDQTGQSAARVTAYDKAGNMTSVTVTPLHPQPFMSRADFLGILSAILVLALGVFLLRQRLWRKRAKRR